MNALKHNLFAAIDFMVKIESGPDVGKAFLIKPPRITIGRDPRCTIRLSDPKVSRQQVEIHFGQNIVCKELSSHHTTKVNGEPCNNTPIKPGDVISFGATRIRFLTRTNSKAQPELPGAVKQRQEKKAEKEKGKKVVYQFLAVIVGLAVVMKMLEGEPLIQQTEKLASVSDLNAQIEETKERIALAREENFNRKSKSKPDRYLHKVESHFVRGFRDYQNGMYSRSLDALGTTIATDQDHLQAQLYSRTARKKRAALIDTHLRDGQKYRDKLMYNRCVAEFEKALIYIDNERSKKYELAKTQLEECRLLMTGGYQ